MGTCGLYHSPLAPFLTFRAQGDGKEVREEEEGNAETPDVESSAPPGTKITFFFFFFYLGRSFTVSTFPIPSLFPATNFFFRILSFSIALCPRSLRFSFLVASVSKADKTENNRRRYERRCRRELTATPCQGFCFCKK